MQLLRPWCSQLQARNARAFHCRFRSILFWSVRSWTQKRQPLKPSGQEASSLVSVAACAFLTPSTYSGVRFCVSPLRGICYRTKTTKRGAPFAFLGFGTYSSGRDFGENWLSVWIFLLDKVWQELRARFGAQVAPDCFFFTLGQLLRLRNFLQEAGIPQAQALSYRLPCYRGWPNLISRFQLGLFKVITS